MTGTKMKLSISMIFFLIITSIFCGNIFAEEDTTEENDARNKFAEWLDSGKPLDDPARPIALPSSAHSEKTQALYEQSMQDYYAYRSKGLAHRSAVFEWQLFSAKLIFVIVVFLVVCGIVFAAIQFKAGMPSASTEVELSAKGLKVSSPVLGVIILTISLAFFYLYLLHVYPVENVF